MNKLSFTCQSYVKVYAAQQLLSDCEQLGFDSLTKVCIHSVVRLLTNVNFMV